MFATWAVWYRWFSGSISMCAILHSCTQAPFAQDGDLRATFERPENWSGQSVVVQTQKVVFLCNCCSTTIVPSLNYQNCCSGTASHRKEVEWRQNRCCGRYWSAKGGTTVVQGRQRHRSNWCLQQYTFHYNDVIMNTIASQITSLTIIYSAVYSGADQRKHQSSASLAFVRRIPRTKGQ